MRSAPAATSGAKYLASAARFLGALNMKPFATLATGTLLAALLSASAIGQPAAPLTHIQSATPNESLRPSSVRAVQQRLHTLGFYRGAIDGVCGQGTQTAIGEFQQNRGLHPTGRLNPATIAAMGLSPDSLTYPPTARIRPLAQPMLGGYFDGQRTIPRADEPKQPASVRAA